MCNKENYYDQDVIITFKKCHIGLRYVGRKFVLYGVKHIHNVNKTQDIRNCFGHTSILLKFIWL